jgi:hypothetical protein
LGLPLATGRSLPLGAGVPLIVPPLIGILRIILMVRIIDPLGGAGVG